MKFPDMDKVIYRFFGIRTWVLSGGRESFDSSRKSMWISPWICRCRIEVAVLRSWPPSSGFWFIHLRLENKISFSFGKYYLFRIESFWIDFRYVHRLQLLKVCNQYVTLTNSTLAYKAYPRNNPGKTFFPNWWILDWSFAVVGWYSINEAKK